MSYTTPALCQPRRITTLPGESKELAPRGTATQDRTEDTKLNFALLGGPEK